MRVRSFEMVGADLRQLHDYLMGVGGFTFRAGGDRFFVLVGERFIAATASRTANMMIVQSEADVVSIDAISAGGPGTESPEPSASEMWFLRRASDLITAFAQRHDHELVSL